MLSNIISMVNGIVWSNAMIIFLVISGLYFSIRLRFVQVTNIKEQVRLTFRNNNSSQSGISTFSSFCTTMAARIGTGNIAGVAVAVYHGGPGAILWMLLIAILSAATSYAECALGQLYKSKAGDEYAGSVCYYISKGMGWKRLAKVFAVLTLICVPILTVGPQANTISGSIQNAFGVPTWIPGILIGLLLVVIVFGGIKRISSAATLMVPFMSILYFIITAVVLVSNAGKIPAALELIVTSAFGMNAVFGGLLGSAISWGIKRAVNSSAAGMGENVPAASAAECSHPGEQGLVNAFGVYIDLIVCLCTGTLLIITDCFNVLATDGAMLHIGSGTANMAKLAETGGGGIDFAQEAISTVLPNMGSILIAVCIFFFAFTCIINYYYQGEVAIDYLCEGKSADLRKRAIFALRLIVPVCFFVFSVVSTADAFSAAEIGVGLMTWFNLIIMWIMSSRIIAINKDYRMQKKAGKKPIFNPEKLNIKNAELWMDINAQAIAEEAATNKI